MKEDILNALKRAKREFESDGFLNKLLKGGYELEARNILKSYLPNTRGYEHEVKIPGTNKIADLVLYPSFEIADFGHNGTWQTQTRRTGLVNKIKSDIDKYIKEPEVSVVYTVGFLTDIVEINKDKIDKVINYEEAKLKLTRELADKRINLVISELNYLEKEHGNELEYEVINNSNQGFEIDMYVFVLGPYFKN
jgi:hypothetical protein